MNLTKVVYSMRKLRNMCVAFDDARDMEAIDFVIADLDARLVAEKASLRAAGQVCVDTLREHRRKSWKPT